MERREGGGIGWRGKGDRREEEPLKERYRKEKDKGEESGRRRRGR